MKRSFIGFCFWMIGVSSFGQNSFSIGAKGGLNFSSLIAGSGLGESFSFTKNFHAGLFVSYRVRNVAIQPEFIFSQQGATGRFNNQSLNTSYQFFNVPVIVKYYFGKYFNVQVGPQIGVLLKAREDFVANSAWVTLDQNSAPWLNTADGSICMGIGYETNFGLTLETRYALAFTPIRNFSGTAYNEMFQFSVGYRVLKWIAN
jgi:hypothetical protein